MLQLSKVHQELDKKKGEISRYITDTRQELQLCEEKLNKCLENYSSSQFNSKLQEIDNLGEDFLGAELTEEFDSVGLIKSLPELHTSQTQWNNWKSNILENRTLFACDGSQFLPDKDLGLFFGAIQTASYINHHSKDTRLSPEENINFEIILPAQGQDEVHDFNEEIYTRRFLAELDQLINILKNLEHGDNYEKRPLGFFDGSFSISFEKNSKRQKSYSLKIQELLDLSHQKRIPVIGYIDNSRSPSLITSLQLISNQERSNYHVTDVSLLNKYIKNWGDRSCCFTYYSSQSNISSQLNDSLGFCYLYNSSYRGKPCKVEIPYWIYQDNLLDEVINVILAESIVGNGYIHILEVADSHALLQHKDKEYICEKILPQYRIQLNKSSKISSKQQRRRNNIKY